MRHALYLIGAPGVGKSTLMAAVTARYERCAEAIDKPFAHIKYPGGIELGARRPDFSGTDALSMSVQPLVEEYIANALPQRVVGEGDRLANDKFFSFLRRTGYTVMVVYLHASQATLDEHREARGSKQNPTWMKGRETKSLRLANNWSRRWLNVDSLSLQAMVDELKWEPALNLG